MGWDAVGPFLLALITNFWLYVTGVGPVAIDGVLQLFIRRYRDWSSNHGPLRRWFIALIAVVGVLWASFAAFQEQYDIARTALDRNTKLNASIENPGGYKAQIKDLDEKIRSLTDKLVRAGSALKPGRPEKPIGPLRRLIAYDLPDPLTTNDTRDGQQVCIFQGFWFHIHNASEDTLTLHLQNVRILVNEKKIVTDWKTAPAIVAQTQMIAPQLRFTGDGLGITDDIKSITVEFEVVYDSIPSTGRRTSYRKVVFKVVWANGPQRPPFIDQPTVVAESET